MASKERELQITPLKSARAQGNAEMADDPNINPYQAAKDGGAPGGAATSNGSTGKSEASDKGNGAEQPAHGQQSTTLKVALDVVALTGAPVFPVGGNKKALIKGWPEKATTDRKQLERWAEQFPGCTWGMPTGPKSGISVIDLDKAKDGDGQSGVDTWQAIRERHPDLSQLKPPVVLTAGGGAHLYFAHVDGAKNSASQIGPGVDVRGEGGYVVIPGSVNDAGKAYSWMEDREFFRPLPPFPLEIVKAELEANKAAESERKEGNREAARAAAPSSVGQKAREQQEKLRAAHGVRSDDDASDDAIGTGLREKYVALVFDSQIQSVATASKGTRNPALNRAALILGHYVGSGDLSESKVVAALKAAAEACDLTADDGIEQVEKTITSGLTAGKKEPWDGRDAQRQLVGAIDPERASTGQSRANGAQPDPEHGKQNGTDGDVRTINGQEWRDSYGPGGPGAGHGFGDDGAARDPGSGGEKSGNGGGRGNQQQKPIRFVLEDIGDEAEFEDAEFLIEGLLPAKGIGVMWGPPKCGKSFVALSQAMHIASGLDWHGRSVRQGAVVYLALEGSRGFKRRCRAFKRHFGLDKPPMYLITVPFNARADAAELIENIRRQAPGIRPALVVVDTLNRSLVGSESKDEDMSAYIRAIDLISDELDCFVQIVHHCGVEGTRPRGHSSLGGAVDVQTACKTEEEDIVLTVEFAKDMEAGDVFIGSLEVVDMGTNKHGQPVTSAIYTPASGEDVARHRIEAKKKRKVRKLSETERLAIRALTDACHSHGRELPGGGDIPPHTKGVKLSEWRALYYSRHQGDDATVDRVKKQFQRARDSLSAKGCIGTSGDLVWPGNLEGRL